MKLTYLSNIPEELRNLKNWCCYKLEKRGDKYTKIPVDANTGNNAKSNDKNTWAEFNTALNACKANNYAGLGFFFEKPYFGVDIDNIKDDIVNYLEGEKDNIIAEFLGTLDSYAEFSRSKTGIHIICKGELPQGGRRKNNVEMYQTGRFFVMTGYRIGDKDKINDCTEEIKFLHSKYIGSRDIVEAQPVQERKIDFNIIEKIQNSKQKDLFNTLYFGGWENKYTSQSEADMALCNILAFWTAKNEKEMDRLFRSSILYRAKWDQKRGAMTYGRKTILEAISKCHNVYEPGQDVGGYEIFVDQDNTQKKEQKKIKKFGYDDTGNADRFLYMYHQDVRYNHTNKVWYIYNGSRWAVDNTGKMKLLAENVIKAMKDEFLHCESEDEEKAFTKHLKATRGNKGKENMIKECMHRVPILTSELDAHKEYFNCSNGFIDLKKGVLCPHEREYFFTKMSNVEYTDKIDCPQWEQFLYEIFGGDMELIHFIQKAIGYSLTGSNREQCMFILFGNGLNGKSVFLDVIADIFGDYAMNIKPETLMVKQYNSSNANPDIARIKGARFVTTTEPNEGVRFDEGLIKQLTGGDKVTARHLYKEEFEFVPEFKIWLATNHKPIIRGNDDGIWRRIHLIPFKVKIPKNKIDKNLKYKLRKELTGILNWAVNGTLMWLKEGLEAPEVIEQETFEYRKEMDVITLFIDECCEIDEVCEVKAGDLYKAYKEWATDNNQYLMSNTKFGKEIGKKFEKIRDSQTRYYKGIKLKGEAEPYSLSIVNF